MGGTTLALARRRRNAALFARVFQGRAIDLGGGPDPLRTDEAWPALRDVLVWDLPNDAHDLSSFPDASFDVVYSSHCIEHLWAPEHAVDEWWRVLRPGGHLVIVAPDSMLYEHDEWPSRFNSDHKFRFSTNSLTYPDEIGVFQLLSWIWSPYRLVSLQWLADGFDWSRLDLDQTATSACECGIEFIVQKFPNHTL